MRLTKRRFSFLAVVVVVFVCLAFVYRRPYAAWDLFVRSLRDGDTESVKKMLATDITIHGDRVSGHHFGIHSKGGVLKYPLIDEKSIEDLLCIEVFPRSIGIFYDLSGVIAITHPTGVGSGSLHIVRDKIVYIPRPTF